VVSISVRKGNGCTGSLKQKKRHGLVDDTSRAHCIFSEFAKKKKSYQVILQKKNNTEIHHGVERVEPLKSEHK
jgi:hypothetical protein